MATGKSLSLEHVLLQSLISRLHVGASCQLLNFLPAVGVLFLEEEVENIGKLEVIMLII